MLPKYLEVLPGDNTAIQIRHESHQYFENTCHFHSDLELNLIVKSTGLRFIGDNIDGFQEYSTLLEK